MPELLDRMKAAALAASDAILAIYGSPFTAEHKQDGSPVTQADQEAEAIIFSHLEDTGIPILAEEAVAAGRIPKLGRRYFVVDPLDGTKEFVKRNGEFTVNIALIEDGRPVMGVVLSPVTGDLYWGSEEGAFFQARLVDGFTEAKRLFVAPEGAFRVVASRSHGHEALGAFCSELAITEDVSVGSSLKFCLLARGDAQFYPRFTPTCEWDTAAGQAVLEAAGGVVLELDGSPLRYGKQELRFLNPFFLAAAGPELGRRGTRAMRNALGASVG
jgi:3'(2'), 5'-bisphosphate nucleotidase